MRFWWKMLTLVAEAATPNSSSKRFLLKASNSDIIDGNDKQ